MAFVRSRQDHDQLTVAAVERRRSRFAILLWLAAEKGQLGQHGAPLYTYDGDKNGFMAAIHQLD